MTLRDDKSNGGKTHAGKANGEAVSVEQAVEQINRTMRDGPPERLLGLIASASRQVLGADVVAITSTEPGDLVVVRAADGRQAREITGIRLPADHRLAQETVVSDEPHLIDLTQQESSLSSVAHCELRSALCVPLISQRRRAGAIHAGRCKDRVALTEHQLRVAGLFAAPALHAVEQLHTREQLRRFGEAPSASDTALRQALNVLSEQIIEAFGNRACTVYLLDTDGKPWIAAHQGSPAPTQPRDFEATEHPAAQAIATHQAVTAPALRGGTWPNPPTIAAVPIMWQSDLYGVLCATFAAGRDVDHQLSLLTLIAGQLAWMTDHARLLILSQQKVVEEERHRLARELHDGVSQVLYGIALGARTAQDLNSSGEAQRLAQPIDYVLQLAHAGLTEVRALISALRSDSVESEGLTALLSKEAEALHARHGVAVDSELASEPAAATESKRVAYRIAREALHNVARHAHARHLAISVRSMENELVVDIADDGVGFDPSGRFPGHLGLSSMRERAREIGGSVRVESEAGKGTRVRVQLPSYPVGQ